MKTSKVVFISLASVVVASMVAKKVGTNVPGLN